MKKVTVKRVAAFLIDIIFIYLIVSLFSNIEVLNPHYKEYEKATNEYIELYEDYTTAIKNNASGQEEIVAQVTEKSYEVSKYGYTVTIIGLVVSTLYFVVFEYFNKGQTVGKKLLKIKVTNDEGKRPTFAQCLIRSSLKYNIILGGSIALGIINVLVLILGSKSVYLQYTPWIQSVDFSIAAVSLLFMMFRKDGKGLHDMLAHTNVLSTMSEVSDVKEANYTENQSENKDNEKEKVENKTR